MKFDFFRVDIWVEKINSSKVYREWTCWCHIVVIILVLSNVHKYTSSECITLRFFMCLFVPFMILMLLRSYFFTFFWKDFSADALVLEFGRKKYVKSELKVTKKAKQRKNDSKELSSEALAHWIEENQRKKMNCVSYWQSTPLWTKPRKKIESKYKNQKKYRPWIDVDSDDNGKERERRNMCVLLWFHCFAQKLTWNQLKFTAGRMKNSAFWIASIVFFVVFPSRFGFQFASFHLSWSLYFFSSRSLSCGTMKNTHASYSNSHTSSKHLCWCFDVAMFTSLDLLCVWCFAFVIVFLARSLFWSLSFLLLVGFCGCCCSNAGAAGVLFSLHTERHRHSLSISYVLLWKHISFVFKRIQCGTHFI